MASFTATATVFTKYKIICMLNIEESDIFFIEKDPNRSNIKYCVQYIDRKTSLESIFKFILDDSEANKTEAARRLIYCQTRMQCATIFNMFYREHRAKLFLEPQNNKAKFVEMFHAGTPKSVKEYIVAQATMVNSHLRIIICKVAFGMGINCSDFHECIHFGAPKTIESYMQEIGRIGRD